MSLLDSLLSDSTETTSLNINMNSTPNSSSPKGSQQSTPKDSNVSTQDSGAPKDSQQCTPKDSNNSTQSTQSCNLS